MNSETKTRQITELLRIRHAPPEWATFMEITTGTGTAGFNRRIDVYTFNIWPSKKYVRIAYEIKVTRANFNQELLQPEKRDPAEQLANECYFVMPVGLVKVDEVPEKWGLLELTKGGLRKKKNAMYRDIDEPPIWFTAALARRSIEEPSKLPEAVWLQAGKEIDIEGLTAVADTSLSSIRYKIKREVQEELEELHGNEIVELRKLRGIIRQQMGYEFGESDKLIRWCNENLNHKRDLKIRGVLATLNRVQKSINDLLEQESSL
jgi:hypothetical protein